jgi:hypothetical protein
MLEYNPSNRMTINQVIDSQFYQMMIEEPRWGFQESKRVFCSQFCGEMIVRPCQPQKNRSIWGFVFIVRLCQWSLVWREVDRNHLKFFLKYTPSLVLRCC